ncbi:uncharacterized protein LOC116339598 [Contarinia nasturtii]|uniref:uncharacterized protein LOC116339598 n=1 Tax=Contarinia nasturtii TaxID=265458 RepID=UPI0012D4B0D6|nr:uncharacterized protein LOC116339598 [Contarinia nasturtii]
MKLFLYVALSFLAMIIQVKSDNYKNLLAYYSLIDKFDEKAKAIDTSINWKDKLQEVLSIPTEEIMNNFKKTNPQWVEQLASAFISIPPGQSSTSTKSVNKQIKSLNENHKKLCNTVYSMVMSTMEPSFKQISGFESAYTKVTTKNFDNFFLDKVKAKLPTFKTTHDQLLAKINTNINGVFVRLRDDYVNKLNSLNEHTSSLPNVLTEIKAAQDKFSVAVSKLSQDLKAFADGAIKCAEFLLDAKNLKFKSNNNLSGNELKQLEKKYEELFGEFQSLLKKD